MSWRPPNGDRSEMAKYIAHVNKAYHTQFKDTHELWQWSVDENAEFWVDLYHYLEIIPPLPPHIKQAYDPSLKMSQVPEFFRGHKINFAENALFGEQRDDDIALIGLREDIDLVKDTSEKVTWRQLRERVRQVSSALDRHGLEQGDRVAAVVANSVWAVVLFLSCAGRGLIFSSINPDLGSEGCVARLQQITPKFLFSDSDAMYKGRRFSVVPKIDAIVSALRVRPRVFVIPTGTSTFSYPSIDVFLSKASPSDPLEFRRLPFMTPMIIVYSSGTTGNPKCIVHHHGICLNLKKVSKLHSGMGKHDNFLQFTSTSWINTTGAPLAYDQYKYFYNAFPDNIALNNGAGGTDVAGSILGNDPIGGLTYGEMPIAVLGIAADVAGSVTGESIKHTGQPGELVIRKPFPSMPVFFWADPGNKIYKASYFERFDNIDVWCQADWVSWIPKTKGWVMHGRSDGVLNPSGIRFGSGEIYAIVEAPPFTGEIADTLCVGRRRAQDNDEAVFLFVKMLPGKAWSPQVEARLREGIAKGLSRRHVPRFILPVDDIPVTINGKKVEIAVKQIISGATVKPSSTVANPEVLLAYERFRNVEDVPKAKL